MKKILVNSSVKMNLIPILIMIILLSDLGNKPDYGFMI